MENSLPEVPPRDPPPRMIAWQKDPFVVGFSIVFVAAFWVSYAMSAEWLHTFLYALGIIIAVAVISLLSRGYLPPPMEIVRPSLECRVMVGWYGVFFILSMLLKGEGILAGEFSKWIWFVIIPVILLWIVRGRKLDALTTLRSFGLHRHGLRRAVLLSLLAYAVMIPWILLFIPTSQFQMLQEIFQKPLKAVIIILLSLVLSFITAASTEELFFRGMLQPRLAKVSGSEVRGCLLAAFLFGLYHLPYAYFLTSWPTHGNIVWALSAVLTEQMLAGVLLGILWIRTHTIIAPILFHTLVNTLGIMSMLKMG